MKIEIFLAKENQFFKRRIRTITKSLLRNFSVLTQRCCKVAINECQFKLLFATKSFRIF